MENASKALIMAAGVLIGMILLSLMVYMFMSFAQTSAEIHKGQDENRLNEFNSQFTAYEGKEGITIHDIVTVANLATENNIYYEFQKLPAGSTPRGDSTYIGVLFRNNQSNTMRSYHNKYIEQGYQNTRDSNYKESINNYYNNLIQAGLNDMVNGELRKYSCEVKISDATRRVYLVTFTAEPN